MFTDWQTDGCRDGQVETSIPTPFNLIEVVGIITYVSNINSDLMHTSISYPVQLQNTLAKLHSTKKIETGANETNPF